MGEEIFGSSAPSEDRLLKQTEVQRMHSHTDQDGAGWSSIGASQFKRQAVQ